MSEYKYEPVFGDQSLFCLGPEDAVSVRYGKSEYIFDSGEIKATTGQLRDVPIVAMRRIIKEPKRWTVEDQKAGRLPVVGAKYMGRDVILECVLADKNGDVWGKSDEGLMHCHSSLDINPIETPEEKAARLREEWCYTAAKQLKNLEYSSTLTSIYDALLSGELTMPSKDGE